MVALAGARTQIMSSGKTCKVLFSVREPVACEMGLEGIFMAVFSYLKLKIFLFGYYNQHGTMRSTNIRIDRYSNICP